MTDSSTTLSRTQRQLLAKAFFEEKSPFRVLSTLRTRRVGLGYKLETGEPETFDWSSRKTVTQPRGPLAYESKAEPIPLTELEEATISWAACGPNGSITADVPVQGGLSAIVSWAGYTVPGVSGAPSLGLLIVNDSGVSLYKPGTERSAPVEISTEADLDKILEWYGQRHPLNAYRPDVGWYSAPEGTHKLNALGPAQYNLNRPGATWFIPVGDLGLEWFNLLLTAYEWWGFYLQDPDEEKPAGCDHWMKPGFLEAPLPIPTFDELVLMLHTAQVGASVQNMRIVCEYMGLGAWPVGTYADDFVLGAYPEIARGLGFQFVERTGPNPTKTFSCVGFPNVFEAVAVPTPRYPTAAAAVEYVKNLRYGADGPLAPDVEWVRKVGGPFDTSKVEEILEQPQAWISDWAVEAAVATVDYIVAKYGIAPGYISPVRAKFSCQVHHVDIEFYKEKRFRDGFPITPAIEDHFSVWHS